MRYIITPQDMRAAEQAAFKEGVPSLLLMETAAQTAFERLKTLLPGGGRVIFACGPGNNGGDGLAMARMWHMAGWEAAIALPAAPATPDAQTNLRYARALGIPIDDKITGRADAVVDALFGTGFHGAISTASVMGEIVAQINAAGCPVLSVDVPSGLDALTGQVLGACVRAAQTVTFHAAKQGLILTAHPELVGRLTVADIGLKQSAGIPWAETLSELLPPRAAIAHKGLCGRAVLHAGSPGMAGAAAMAALACLRAGAGLVTVVCPREIVPILQAAVPNAMCRAAEDRPDLRGDARLFGCGLSETEETWQALLRLHDETVPDVWDAGALNLLSAHPMRLGPNAYITPHPGEAARLLNMEIRAVTADLPAAARALSEKYGCNAVLKSHVSVICAYDGSLAVNTAGSPALAKGGSGDALSGILTALLAQGLQGKRALQAACLWLGRAGEIAARKYGVRAALTSDVIACLGDAEREIYD